MRKFTYIFILCLSAFTANVGVAASNAKIAKHIDQLIKATDPNVNIGVYVVDLDNDKLIYSRNAKRSFTPASTQKLLTAAAALLYFGPSYEYQTKLLSDAKISRGKHLKGNLYLKLDVDPSLKKYDILNLFSQLRRRHIQEINGNIIIDSTEIAKVDYGPGWMIEDSVYGYGTKNGPVVLDENRFNVFVEPTTINKKAYVKLIQPNPAIKIINHLITKAKNAHCKIKYKMNPQNELTVSGCVALNAGSDIQSVAVNNPLKYATDIIKWALRELAIKHNGQIKLGETPKKARRLALHESAPLSYIVSKMLKPSDNLYAESVYLKLGAQYYKQPGSWRLGRKAMQSILKKKAKVNFQSSIVKDGSGMSRYNLITPKQLVSVLAYMFQHFPAGPEFIAAMPIGGEDGTLRKRMKKQLQGYVRAKTGGMRGVTALAGYIYTKHGNIYAFAIMTNGVTKSLSKYRHLEEKIVKYLQASSAA